MPVDSRPDFGAGRAVVACNKLNFSHFYDALFARHEVAAISLTHVYRLQRFADAIGFLPRTSLGCLLIVASLGAAQGAEDTIRGTTASTQPHPELRPEGIRDGSFLFFPSIAYSLEYNDNVFATENNTDSGFVSEIVPSITARSDWNNHALTVSARSLVSRNHEFSSEDYTDGSIDADAVIDVSGDTDLAFGAGVGIEHVARTAPDDARGIEPTEFRRVRLSSRIAHRSGRTANAVSLSLVDRKYEDVEAIRLGLPVTIDNSGRDRIEQRLRWRLGYRYLANQQAFLSLEANRRVYERRPGFGGIDRSSSGLETLLGFDFDYHGILLGEIALGYRSQDYEEPLEDIDAVILEAGLRWNLTDLTTLNLDIDHEVQESVDRVFSGYTSQTASVGVDHELRRNLVVNLSLTLGRDDFIGGGGSERVDDTIQIRSGATYRMNRHIFFNAELRHTVRQSDFTIGATESDQFDFTQNLISFQLQAQF